MPKIKNPHHGSLAYWPRRRAKREYARVHSWAKVKEPKLLGFAGYKVGMTHAIISDNRAYSQTKGEDVFCPVTVLECPPLKIASINFYKKTPYGSKLSSAVFSDKLDKELERKMIMPKKIKKRADDITLSAYTQPKLTGIKKKPELFEIAIGGSKEEKLNYAKDKLGKEIEIKDVFQEGQQLDTHAITKGKGFQGPVRRFGIGLRAHKSEKARRNPGSLGSWNAQQHIMWRVAHAAKTGYSTRTEYNKLLLKIVKPEETNPKSGFMHYGVVKNQCVFIKGSVAGPAKRLIRFNYSTRPNKGLPKEAPSIKYVNLKTK